MIQSAADVPNVVVVRASVAPMHAEARVSSMQVSQQLAGHAVSVLEVRGDWIHARGEDGYEGWMHRGYLDMSGRRPPAEGGRRLSLGCRVQTADGRATGTLPLGAWVHGDDVVLSGETVTDAARPTMFPRDGTSIAKTAVERYVGTPYQWGGVSTWGADCSGIVQTAFWLHGVSLPRDAWQQAETGCDAGAELASWFAADLLFFSDRDDRRITHVGIALGDSRMVHLALGRGGYAVERLTDMSDPYIVALMSRFVVARRVVEAVGRVDA